ncbi:MAG: maltose alpha-D-glucosyltransferase/alpha-amylase [Saprospiraceae bacterium]|jgi:maltose alpha-D-glucosyltransferase/alpha-amylase
MPKNNNQNLWYKDAIIYTLHIKSFFDSSGNGMGDINGLIQKLDYLDDLGVNCISLLPFCQSPLKDDGYDISDYKMIHPDYGTMEQFQQFLAEAKKRGIRIIIDQIINHTSVQHEWFQRARKAKAGSKFRNYYIWSKTQEKYQEAEVMFSDYENSNWAWDNEAKEYYWHRFYSHQADLNFESEAVKKEIRDIIDFWFDMGVDGMRISSVMFLFQKENTDCVNLPEVHDFVKSLRKYVDEKHTNKIILAETNLWPEDAAEYFGKGDECHMNFHFPLMPRLYMALQTEDRYPIIDILEQTPAIPENCQWALFLRNHDDLTLSMVTEEERDYLYKVYAQDHGAKINDGIRRRLAPLLGNDRRKIELLNNLLFSLPGTPVLYYGDEIGMGDNIYLGDRNSVRTPMQWNANRNAGFSTTNPQKLFLPVIVDPQYRFEAVNVENQSSNTSSLLWWMKNIISMRKRLKAFSHGDIRFLQSNNSKILAFTRSYGNENILVVCNLSKYSQSVELDLKDFKGDAPIEIFSQNKFLKIGKKPYPFTLGPYGYYWFNIEREQESAGFDIQNTRPEISVDVEWDNYFETYISRSKFVKDVLPNYLNSCRWYGSKSKKIVSIEIENFPKMTTAVGIYYFLNVDIRFTDGLPETYSLPAAFITDPEEILELIKNEPQSVICHLNTVSKTGIIVDAIALESFRNELFYNIQTNQQVEISNGYLKFESGKILGTIKLEKADITSEILKAEQSNTSVIYNNQFFFKIYRKLDTDVNPDLELVRFLSEKTAFKNSPRYGGGIEYFDNTTRRFTILGLLQDKIPNQGEAWTSTLESLTRYYEKVSSKISKSQQIPDLIYKDRFYFENLPETHQKLIGSVMNERVVKLAQRTAEMHIALAANQEEKDFEPERFTEHYQRSIYSGHRKLVAEKLDALASRLETLPKHIRQEAQKILDLRPQILECFSEIYSKKINATKIRIHGDYHLGQVLFNGKDFYIIDFEGEPLHSISERRLKKTPFKDVAGMIRSFHYAAFGQLVLNQNYRQEDMAFLEDWAAQWFHYINQIFLTAYYDAVEGQSFMPKNKEAREMLLRIYTLEKAIYEVGYEMGSRPNWLRIPIRGVLYVMEKYLENKK